MSSVRCQAFTIIELLSVCVAMLMTLMGRAVHFVRGRVCDMDRSNWQRQIGIVIQSYERGDNIPSNNGRGYEWTGNPNRGFQRTQPRGCVCNVLPLTEQTSVLDLGCEIAADSSPQKTAALLIVQTLTPRLELLGRASQTVAAPRRLL